MQLPQRHGKARVSQLKGQTANLTIGWLNNVYLLELQWKVQHRPQHGSTMGCGEDPPCWFWVPPTLFMLDLWSYLAVEGSGLSPASSGIPSLRLLPELGEALEKVRHEGVTQDRVSWLSSHSGSQS